MTNVELFTICFRGGAAVKISKALLVLGVAAPLVSVASALQDGMTIAGIRHWQDGARTRKKEGERTCTPQWDDDRWRAREGERSGGKKKRRAQASNPGPQGGERRACAAKRKSKPLGHWSQQCQKGRKERPDAVMQQQSQPCSSLTTRHHLDLQTISVRISRRLLACDCIASEERLVCMARSFSLSKVRLPSLPQTLPAWHQRLDITAFAWH